MRDGAEPGDFRPTREQILAYITENPDQAGKREIAKAFGLRGADRVWLKDMLRDIVAVGADRYTQGSKTVGSVLVSRLKLAGS